MERKEFIRTTAVGNILFASPVFFNACSKNMTDVNTNGASNNNSQGEITVDLSDPNFSVLQTVGGYTYK